MAWDDKYLTGALSPVKWLLRALSSITLAVAMLVGVAIYGILASVPIGLLALIPSKVAIGITLLFAIFAAVLPVILFARWYIRKRGGLWRQQPLALAMFSIVGLFAGVLAVYAWHAYAWPILMFDPATHKGLRLFPEFVENYGAVTLRRLPGVEMSELEFYAWWPLRWMLLVFIVNMVVATVRRIDFTFKNIGVLTVHTGIVLMALGSVYYAGLKREGDTVLFAGNVDPQTGIPGAGPPQNVFFDNTRTVLYLDAGFGWEQRPLDGVPRYNDYNLWKAGGDSAMETAGMLAPWRGMIDRNLSIPIQATPGSSYSDISARMVGYCYFAKPTKDFIRLPADVNPNNNNPLRIVYMHSQLPDASGVISDDPVLAFKLVPKIPSERVSEQQGVFSLEYTAGADAGMNDERWADITTPLPEGTFYALTIEVPSQGTRLGASFKKTYPVSPGQSITIGDTGYVVEVKELLAKPPFPIITEGYKGATSSVAVLAITPPISESNAENNQAPMPQEAYERYVYHRFAEIAQDMVPQTHKGERPKRRDADPKIKITLIDAAQLAVYLDDKPDGSTRAAIRQRGGAVKVIDTVPQHVKGGQRIENVIQKISLSIGHRWENSRQIERPAPASAEDIRQDREAVGTHAKAMLAVEVSAPDKQGKVQSEVVWLPFTKFFGMGPDAERTINLGGRTVSLAFGRLQHQLPGFALRLTGFEMISYDHRGAPRDYQSTVRVVPTSPMIEERYGEFEHITQLNAPLTAPFLWREDRGLIGNITGRIAAGLNPNQFKFAQAGWDASGWERTQAMADRGEAKRPHASFTILGVGNYPGVHVIAFGSVLMGLGIPWAFYVKPWLVRREKRRIQQALADGTYVAPKRHAASRA